MPERRDRTERLMNLVLCLLGTSRPVPRHVIEQSVEGYGDARSASAFERMFERDKDDLRSLGIPIETVSDVDGTVIGYRIPHDQYQPVQLNVSPDQARLIGLVPLLWQGEWAHTARIASKKIELHTQERATLAPKSSRVGGAAIPPPPAVSVCLEALSSSDNGVEFDYAALEGAHTHRRVVPRRVRVREGAWYLWGFDLDRQAFRSFRMSRMSNPRLVALGDEKELHITEAESEPSELSEVRVKVAKDRGAELRTWASHTEEDSGGEDRDVVTVRGDSWRLRWLLLRAGEPVLPESSNDPYLVPQVIEAAQRILDAHREDS